MSISKRVYGENRDGEKVYCYTLENSKGMKAEIINYGAILTSLQVTDNEGKFDDIVLGYDSIEGYFENPAFLGSTIGRYANRIENASFELNGVRYNLTKSEGENQLHGGLTGFHKVLWEVAIINDKENPSIELTYLSKDGEEGYPGNLKVKVRYTVTENNELKIDYDAISDKDTVINLTNHSYFNLSGHASGTALDHKVMINADRFTVIDSQSIPTGELRDVKGTPMDFTKPFKLGERINDDYEQLIVAKGYDHNWCLNADGNLLEKSAEVIDDKTGRIMEVYTTMPGVQLYSGNYLDGSIIGKNKTVYNKRSALCLETQFYPNSMNVPSFPSPVFKEGQEYKHTTIYKFLLK
ncbi:aldose epimerase family protein [Clostridium folliculivorans]|uniref:Aldose 1-epimerase n=1 Tax=Clostridium folliculivorans TaxID=2886038 RepID=A0A9W5Y0P8_9CLOT|nr:aldose epimerase family protein [Clostridium folliculivorans]GKU24594.1 aldose 1-epimerase [Clostridium folliculivorans]GKU30692.1 aldose 1-epimerase [Clostridium folliculivorans]